MIPLNPLEHQNAVKTLYSKCVGKICQKHDVTRMELDILLFLANNPCFDTASDIVEMRYLSKSQVSASVKMLEARGYIRKEYAGDNRKTVHLTICDTASGVVADGKEAQERFLAIMMEGIPQEELDSMRRCMSRILENIDEYLKSDGEAKKSG
jgi:Transcriptional regulators